MWVWANWKLKNSDAQLRDDKLNLMKNKVKIKTEEELMGGIEQKKSH